MKGTLSLKTAPTSEPVTTAEAKSHMRVDISTDDTLIGNLIKAARRWIEDITGIRMVNQTWNYYLDEFPDEDVIELPIGPVSSLTSIKYTNDDDVTSTFSSGSYKTDLVSLPARIRLKDGKSWPADTLKIVNGVDIEFVSGYGTDATNVPEELKLAIKMLVAHWYENRETVGITKLEELPFAFQALILNFKMFQGG